MMISLMCALIALTWPIQSITEAKSAAGAEVDLAWSGGVID